MSKKGEVQSVLRRGGTALWAAALLAFAVVPTSAQPSADEAAVRATLAACVEAWNRHQPKAFGDVCLTEDVWFSETDDKFYKRFQGREKVLGTFGYNIETSDLQWQVVRVKPMPDATMAVELKQRIGILPRTQDGYTKAFDSDPSLARLRREGGAWKVFFFTSHVGWARSLLLDLDKPAPAVAATPAPADKPDARVPPGNEPVAYSIPFGQAGTTSCLTCHGRPPTVSEDGDRARIIAGAAAATDAAGLRRIMAASRAGGGMGNMLADPALTDERLDAIRLWMRAMRDGRAERVGDRVVIHNPRSEHDPPARLALLRAEGGWRLPKDGGGCRQGAALKGGKQCEIRLPRGSRGALVFRFAPSEGLQPQEVRLALEPP
jgi:cytochrome c553